MRQVYALVRQLAATDVTLTLTGETGTGKDVLAHLVHERQPARARAVRRLRLRRRSAQPGRERAVRSRARRLHRRARRAPGRLRARAGRHAVPRRDWRAAAGAAAAPAARARRPLGAPGRRHRRRRVDVRVIAATNRDLGALVAAKQFRQDLYFRLAAAIVQLPPLRDRLDDLPLLVPRLLRGSRARRTCSVPEATLAALRAPQLAGQRSRAQERARVRARVRRGRACVEPHHLRFASPPSEDAGARPAAARPATRWSSSNASPSGRRCSRSAATRCTPRRSLGIAPSTLYEKVKKYGL